MPQDTFQLYWMPVLHLRQETYMVRPGSEHSLYR
jgi:hypothetical protein